MCYVCNCFAWALDVVQRLVTYCLACIISGVVCIGLVVAIAAGIAYGYNYSMAEFLTFTRQDVTVYMRRGQFYDRPDIDADRGMRRSNDEDAFGLNKSSDYQDGVQTGARALPDTWAQVKDTKNFVDLLTKYSQQKAEATDDTADEEIIRPVIIPESMSPEKVSRTSPKEWTAPEWPVIEKEWKSPEKVKEKIVSVSPNPGMVSTVMIDTGASQIIVRKFQPVADITHIVTTTRKPPSNFFYDNPRDKVRPTLPEPTKTTEQPDIKIVVEDGSRNQPYVPMRSWATTDKKGFQEYPDDVDEDNIMYKPV